MNALPKLSGIDEDVHSAPTAVRTITELAAMGVDTSYSSAPRAQAITSRPPKPNSEGGEYGQTSITRFSYIDDLVRTEAPAASRTVADSTKRLVDAPERSLTLTKLSPGASLDAKNKNTEEKATALGAALWVFLGGTAAYGLGTYLMAFLH